MYYWNIFYASFVHGLLLWNHLKDSQWSTLFFFPGLPGCFGTILHRFYWHKFHHFWTHSILSVDFCHSCLFNSKIDMCAFLFASVSFIRGSTTFRIVSSLVLKRCLLHVWKIYNWLISVVIWPWRWWLNSPDLGPLSLFFHTLGNKVTCGSRLMKHTTFL